MSKQSQQIRAEALAVLTEDGGWMPSNAIFNRVNTAKHKSEIGFALAELVESGEAQQITGAFGFEFAAAGVPPPGCVPMPAPVENVDPATLSEREPSVSSRLEAAEKAPVPASSKAPTPAPAAPSSAPELAPAPDAVAKAPRASKDSASAKTAGRVAGRATGQTRQLVADYLAAHPQADHKEIAAALRVSIPTVSYHRSMLDRIAAAEDKAQPPAAPNAKTPRPTSAPRAAATARPAPASTSTPAPARFALWSNGELAIEARGQTLLLPPEDANALIQYAQRMGAGAGQRAAAFPFNGGC